MNEIVLTTFNARYWHSAFGLRDLLANMGELQPRTGMFEFGIHDQTVECLATVLDQQPRIVGIGVYIWNVEIATRFVSELKRVSPRTIVVVGGPEVSHESHEQAIVQSADYVIRGEADLAFVALCKQILDGAPPLEKIIDAGVPQLDALTLPYDLYSDEDIANRVIYVEASRGCPFTCEFCLSALEIPVRMFDLNQFLQHMQSLLDRGARQFKFVDRTFNLNIRVSNAVLQFFLDRYRPGMFLHFEMIPDRLPDQLRTLISQFPPGVLQFEIGVQTFNDAVGERISRRQDNQKLEDNFRFLRQETGVHIHADLIIGLPGETVESFGRGFDRLHALQPQEIQVGILKRLRGTPITRHDVTWSMVYGPHPPYEIMSTRDIDFPTMQRLRRFARFWDLVGNSGNFATTARMICETDSAFAGFLRFSDWIFAVEQRTHGISLIGLAERVFEFLTTVRSLSPQQVAAASWEDYRRSGRKDRPLFLHGFDLQAVDTTSAATPLPTRQARHVAS